MIHDMPAVDTAIEAAKFSETELAFVKLIVGRGGKLRSTKPIDGTAAYVWRMVAFQISPIPAHQCMPVTADFGLPEWDNPRAVRHEKLAARRKELDAIVDRIVNEVPKAQWHGIRRWGRALGSIG